ncbi:MAG: CDP-diacylglycerol--serine O-phosphatidyltransferase [Gammaproteobacteria bacterium]|nr:CDP-diacylglycerol--serine O-phosphatidyltransferase [Gammaproteobacteria bacterium]
MYLLPNLFTTAALFFGFFAIIAAMNGRFTAAAVAVLVAAIMDGLDGRVARLTNTQSDFGAEYDSLSDMVSFGVAPALIVYVWALDDLASLGWKFANLAWLAAFLYAACAGLRLARFNTQIGKADKRFFQGLASPAAAGVMVCLVWLGEHLDYRGEEWAVLTLLVTVIAGLLMVSRFAYYSFKDIGARSRVPFLTLLLPVLLLVLIAIDPPTVLFSLAALYALSGPALALFSWTRKRLRGDSTASGAR